MELFETKKHYIITNGSVALFCDRLSGYISFSEANELPYEWNPVCLGTIKGFIGKLKFFTDGESKLMLINKIEKVGDSPIFGPVYRIAKITTIALNASPVSNLEIDLCKRHHFGIKKTDRIATPTDPQKSLMKGIQEHMKNVNIKPKRIPWKSEPITLSNDKDIRDREKFERRMLEEFEKMFQENESGDLFYLCCDVEKSYDITSNIQRQKLKKYNSSWPLWRRADERFFWNKSMLQEAIDSADQLLYRKFGRNVFQDDSNLSESNKQLLQVMIRQLEEILIPIIQGFVQIKPFKLNLPTHSPVNINLPNLPQIDLKHEYEIIVGLISRRNRHRAGTRFRRRGVDENGNVANYVETEQFLKVDNDKSPHLVSFVQIRGSVPVFWSQFSLKYHPPIILERSEEENQEAFKQHFEAEFQNYEKVVIVNLVDTNVERSERKIADAYLQHLIKFNSPNVTCVMFDFHDYCRGLQFDNVSILIKGITEIFRDMKYSWVDKKGLICEQKSIFRVNCVDCLDRTNVVQCMLAGVVIETQLRKLGLLSPEESLPSNFYQVMQFMWANNGDALSRQYSGTAAMKGDFTRTGMRTMNGLVKDGMSSMNRYYLRLREMSRQAAIDLMIGNENSAEVINLRSGRNDSEQKLIKQKEDNIKELAHQCKKACLKSNEECLGESILIFCNENEKEFQDMNTVALITFEKIYFVRIDFLTKRPPLAISLPMQSIKKIQIGYELNIFRIRQNMIRVYYDLTSSPIGNDKSKIGNVTDKQSQVTSENELSNNFFAFKQPSLRLFNNILIDVRCNNDHLESLKAIAESFYAAAKNINPNVTFDESLQKFEKSKSNPIPAQWVFPININSLYENVMLSSSLANLNDDDEDILNLEDQCDALESYEHLSVDDYPNENNSPEKEDLKTMTNMDFLRKSFSKVKDKMKDYTFPSKNALMRLPKMRNNKKIENVEVEEEMIRNNGLVRKCSLDVRLQTNGEMHQILRSSKEQDQKFLTASRGRLGSSSDDESTRRPRVQNMDAALKKSKSGFLNFPSEYIPVVDELENYPSSNEEDGNYVFHRARGFLRKLSQSNNKVKHFSAFKNEVQKRIKFKNERSSNLVFPSLTRFYSSETEVFRRNQESISTEKVIMVEDIFLKSCGIISITIPKFNIKTPPHFSLHGTAQLAAITGGAYQRRAERISLQLSIDETPIESKNILLKSSPNLSTRQKFHENIPQSFKEPIVPDFIDSLQTINKSAELKNMITYIKIPCVDVRNPKARERLTKKQIDYAMFIEECRKKNLGLNQPLVSGMIIF